MSDILERMLADAVRTRGEELAKPPPIPCLGRWTHTTDGSDFDCDYAHPPTCEGCIINGGPIDPRTGKRFAQRGSMRRRGT